MTPTSPVQSKQALNRELSDRIKLARVIAIVSMIMVHVPPGIPQWNLVIPLQYLFAEGIHTDLHTWFGLIKSFLIEGIGRTSACLLSIVAGYLAAVSMAASQPSHWVYVAKRFRALYLPMVFWSSLTLILFAGMSVFVRPTFLNDGLDSTSSPVLYLFNIVFFVTDSPYGATIQLAFLRDIFICALLLPLILIAIRTIAPLFLLALTALYLADINTLIILRPLILLCFSLGVWVAIRHISLSWIDTRFWLWGGMFLVSTLCLVALKQDALDILGIPMSSSALQMTIDRLLYPLSRLSGSLFLWSMTARLVQSRFGVFAIKLSPLLFVSYCSHVLVLGVIYALLWQPLFGGSSSVAYPVWFFSAPAIVLLTTFIMLFVTRKLLPGVYLLISGSLMTNGPDHSRLNHRPKATVQTNEKNKALCRSSASATLQATDNDALNNGYLTHRSPGTP